MYKKVKHTVTRFRDDHIEPARVTDGSHDGEVHQQPLVTVDNNELILMARDLSHNS